MHAGHFVRVDSPLPTGKKRGAGGGRRKEHKRKRVWICETESFSRKKE